MPGCVYRFIINLENYKSMYIYIYIYVYTHIYIYNHCYYHRFILKRISSFYKRETVTDYRVTDNIILINIKSISTCNYLYMEHS